MHQSRRYTALFSVIAWLQILSVSYYVRCITSDNQVNFMNTNIRKMSCLILWHTTKLSKGLQQTAGLQNDPSILAPSIDIHFLRHHVTIDNYPMLLTRSFCNWPTLLKDCTGRYSVINKPRSMVTTPRKISVCFYCNVTLSMVSETVGSNSLG
jgi:hypothetical protein